MAVIAFVIGTIGLDYTPNADRQIEASSRQSRRQGGECFRTVMLRDRRHIDANNPKQRAQEPAKPAIVLRRKDF